MKSVLLFICVICVCLCSGEKSPLVLQVYTYSETPNVEQDRVVLNQQQVVLDAGSYGTRAYSWNYTMTGKNHGAYKANPYVFQNMNIDGKSKITFMPPCAGAYMFRYCGSTTCVLDAYLTVEGPEYLPPVANFSVNAEQIDIGQTFVLDASLSTDPQNGSLTFVWQIYQIWPQPPYHFPQMPLWTLQTNDTIVKYTPTETYGLRIILNVYNGYLSYDGRLVDFVSEDVNVRDYKYPLPQISIRLIGGHTYYVNDTVQVSAHVTTQPSDNHLNYYWVVEGLYNNHEYGIYGFSYFPTYVVADGWSYSETVGIYSTNGALPNSLFVDFPAGMIESCSYDANWKYVCSYSSWTGDYQVKLCVDDGHGFSFDPMYCSNYEHFEVL